MIVVSDSRLIPEKTLAGQKIDRTNNRKPTEASGMPNGAPIMLSAMATPATIKPIPNNPHSNRPMSSTTNVKSRQIA